MNATEPNGPATVIEATGGQLTIPDFEIDSLARCLLPAIQAYFAGPEGQAAFEDWQQQHHI